MKIGLCSWAFSRAAAGRRDVADLAALAAAAGFAVLEGGYNPRGALAVSQAPPAELAIPVASIATLEFHRLSLVGAQEEKRREADVTVASMISCARAWGVPSISFSPGAVAADADRRQAIERLAEDLAPHAARARELGVALALENVPGHLLKSRTDLALLLKLLPSVGLCLDVGNAVADGPLRAWYDLLADRIVKVHLSDAAIEGGQWRAAGLGDGAVNWGEVRELLADLALPEAYVEVLWDGRTEERAFASAAADRIGRLLG